MAWKRQTLRSQEYQPSEHQIQCAYFDWVDLQAKQDRRYRRIFAIPNGGDRHFAVAAKLKKEGVRRGVLDVCIAVAVTHASTCWIPGCFIEFKRHPNKPTIEQQEWIEELLKGGFCVALAYSWEAAAGATRSYLAGELDTGKLHIVGR